jgi:hypothetical protein
MGKKHHSNLSATFERKFPKLFEFEFCSLLFIDASNGCLYKIQDADNAPHTSEEDETEDKLIAVADNGDENPEKTKTHKNYYKRKHVIVRLPKERGLTGIAIKSGRVQVVNDGKDNNNFAGEIDNIVGTAILSNMIIGPCFDSNRNLRGLIQLVNKLGSDPISFRDEREFS